MAQERGSFSKRYGAPGSPHPPLGGPEQEAPLPAAGRAARGDDARQVFGEVVDAEGAAAGLGDHRSPIGGRPVGWRVGAQSLGVVLETEHHEHEQGSGHDTQCAYAYQSSGIEHETKDAGAPGRGSRWGLRAGRRSEAPAARLQEGPVDSARMRQLAMSIRQRILGLHRPPLLPNLPDWDDQHILHPHIGEHFETGASDRMRVMALGINSYVEPNE